MSKKSQRRPEDESVAVNLPSAPLVWNDRAQPGYVYKIAGDYFFLNKESGRLRTIMQGNWFLSYKDAVKEYNSFHEHMAWLSEQRIERERANAKEHRDMKKKVK